MVLVLLGSRVAIPMLADNNGLPRPSIIIESKRDVGMQMRILVRSGQPECQAPTLAPFTSQRCAGSFRYGWTR